MKVARNPLEIIAAAGCQGVALGDTEALILLGYLEGHDYCLMMDEHRKMWLHDNQDGENDENDTPYTIRDVIELCQELNGEILLEEESRETTQPEYILDLHKDEILLERMMEKASAAIPPASCLPSKLRPGLVASASLPILTGYGQYLLSRR